MTCVVKAFWKVQLLASQTNYEYLETLINASASISSTRLVAYTC